MFRRRLKPINENKLAKEIAALEGSKEELSIAQIKEVLRITLEILGVCYMPSQVIELLEKKAEKILLNE